jgi:hypothetical protein
MSSNYRIFAVVSLLSLIASTAKAELLVSAEFQGTANTGQQTAPNFQSGNETAAAKKSSLFSSEGTTWNHLEIAQYPAAATADPSFSNLIDRGTNQSTSVGFSITGNTVAYNNSPSFLVQSTNVARDFFLFNIASLGLSTTATWQISGLKADTSYALYLYGGGAPDDERGVYQTIDTDGNGSTADNSAVLVGSPRDSGELFMVTSNSSGSILGLLSGNASKEGNWSGFQLAEVAVPEPSTLALLGSAVMGLLAYAWRKRK